MEFSLDKSLEILSATPLVLQAMLGHLSNDWLDANEGDNTWSPIEVLRHLVLADKTNWIPRAKIILSGDHPKEFVPFVRTAHDDVSDISSALTDFSRLRAANILTLNSYRLSASDLCKTGTHPEFGTVTLSELLATWTVHDLSHIAQISRVMAKQYKTAVGPWTAYLKILA